MGLMEQIEKEEEELKKLEAAENGEEGDDKDASDEDENNENEEGDNEEGDENDGDASDEDKEGDETEGDEEGSDSDDKDGDEDDDNSGDGAENEGDKPKSKAEENNLAAQLRKERKEKLKLQEQLAAARENGQQPPAQNPPAKGDEEGDKGEELTAEQRLDRLEQEKETRELQTQAIQEFNDIEKQFSADTPDYEDASAHMIKAMYNGVKSLNPGISDEKAVGAVQNKVLQIASIAAQRGQNPAEVLYQMAFDHYGFDPANVQKPSGTPQKKTGKAENLKKIVKNKKKSASPLAGGGQNAGANVTIEEADNMDLADFGNMSESEIDDLINQAQS